MPGPGQTLEDEEPLEEIWQCDCRQLNANYDQHPIVGELMDPRLSTPVNVKYKRRNGEYEQVNDSDYGGDKWFL